MPDVLVTVPKDLWAEWIAEGDLPGDDWSGLESHFNLAGPRPDIAVGERVYICSHGRLRGYAPLCRIDLGQTWGEWRPGGFALVRRDGATARTIDRPIRGFRGWRYRWWSREEERPFPDWQTAGVPEAAGAAP